VVKEKNNRFARDQEHQEKTTIFLMQVAHQGDPALRSG